MDDDTPLLNTPNLVALVLREAAGAGATAEACADRLEPLFGPGESPGRDATVARCATHIRWLRKAGMIAPSNGCWAITPRGQEALAAHPDGMDLADLAAYPEFAAWLAAEDAAEHSGGAEPARQTAYDEGYSARHQGAAFTDNPYSFATAGHGLWEKGWCEALDEEEQGPDRSTVSGRRRDAN